MPKWEKGLIQYIVSEYLFSFNGLTKSLSRMLKKKKKKKKKKKNIADVIVSLL